IDFAYRIHTDVGHRTIGAKVNGRIVPLDHRLQSGDIVEIVTSKAARGPSRDWIGMVRTPGAREKIRQWFKRSERDENITHGTDAATGKASSERERHVEVEWKRSAARTYPVAIRIEGWDRDGFLRDVAAVISENQVALVALSALANPDRSATVNATLQVTSV